jgi:hypothetical protein
MVKVDDRGSWLSGQNYWRREPVMHQHTASPIQQDRDSRLLYNVVHEFRYVVPKLAVLPNVKNSSVVHILEQWDEGA